jgi:hypothetical protein
VRDDESMIGFMEPRLEDVVPTRPRGHDAPEVTTRPRGDSDPKKKNLGDYQKKAQSAEIT